MTLFHGAVLKRRNLVLGNYPEADKMLENVRADLRRYPGTRARRLFLATLSQGFWAVFAYRVSHRLYHFPKPLRLMAWVPWLPIAKMVECATGVQIGDAARIGPGLYIGHFGTIIVSGKAVIGSMCNLSQGVTIGIAGNGAARGVPVIGDRVYIGPGAKVIGLITVGDDAAIGANAVVTKSVRAGTTVGGVPAREISERGSASFLDVE